MKLYAKITVHHAPDSYLLRRKARIEEFGRHTSCRCDLRAELILDGRTDTLMRFGSANEKEIRDELTLLR